MHGVASATMGLHGSVWRFTVPLVSGACFGVSWLCVAYSVPVPCACVGKASGIYWNCVCITPDVICTLFTRKEVYF